MDISSVIILIYFAITMLVSVICRQRDTQLQKMLAAPQELGVMFMVPLIFSGLFGGSTVTGTISSSFVGGMSSVWYLLGTAAGCVMFLLLVFPFYRAMSVVKKSVSIPDAYYHRFDSRTRTLMVLVIVVTNALALSTIPLSTAGIISNITGLDYESTVWVCGAVLIGMSLLSGLKGVAAMNIVHTIVMFLGLIVLLIPCMKEVGSIQTLKDTLPANYFDITDTGFSSILAVLLGAVLAIITSPLAFMTVVSSDKPRNAKLSMYLCALLILPFAACLVIIGMCCKVLEPDLGKNVVLYDVAQSFSTICYVFISMSVLAATFSTAPASLLSIITTLNNDIFVAIKKDATEKQQKLFVNIGVVVLTIVLMLIGKNAPSILGQLTGATQIKSVASVVLIVALGWKRVDSNGAFYSLLAGSLVAMGWHMAGNPFGIQPLWPALLVTAVVLLALTLPLKQKVSAGYANYQAVMDVFQALPREQQ